MEKNNRNAEVKEQVNTQNSTEANAKELPDQKLEQVIGGQARRLFDAKGGKIDLDNAMLPK